MATESPPRTILCEEVFDEHSQPSEEEVREYAIRIGIEPDAEPQLLPLARDGLMKALPSGWTPCFDHKKKAWYYFNYDNGTSQWEHPLDCVYRDLVRKNRSESASSAGEEDSKTSAKEDLKSFEEAAVLSLDSVPKSLEPLQPSGSLLRRATTQLAPLKKLPSRLEPMLSVGEKKQKLIPRPPPSPTPIPGTSSKPDDKLQKAQEKHPKSMHGRTELTLSGGGTSFLKKPLTPSSDSSLSEGHDDNAPIPVWTKPAVLTPPRGILRDTSPQRLFEADLRDMNNDEKQQFHRQELEEERKSVRFNLEEGAGLQIRFLEEEDDYSSPEPKATTGESVTIRLHPPEPEQEDDGSNSDDDKDIETLPPNSNYTTADANYEPIKQTVNESFVKESPRGKVKFTVERVDDKEIELLKLKHEADMKFEQDCVKLKSEMEQKISDYKEKLQKEEESEIKVLNEKNEERLNMVKESLFRELESREANIKDGAEKTLEQLREELASSMEKQLAALKNEKQAAIVAEEAELKIVKEEAEQKLSDLRQSLQETHDKFEQEQKDLILKENAEKIEKLKKELSLQFDKDISDVLSNLEANKKQQQTRLEKEFLEEEERDITNIKKLHEEALKNTMSALEKTHTEEIQKQKEKLELQRDKKIAQIEMECECKIKATRDKLAEDHNTAVDKIKTEQLVTFENLRISMQREEEEMHVAHRQKLANLSDKMNAEYESRLKRLREAADRKTKMLEEEERTATKFEQQGTVASLSRTTADIDNSGGHQRCEQLQRQIELLSIKLRESRRQLEEAKASRPDDRVFEKLRCEKRLLEDKYRTLKDKYVRLKADVKQSLEKRNKKRLAVENNRAGGTTGSETDRSTSQKHNVEKTSRKLPTTEENVQESIIEVSETNNNNNIDTHTSSSIKESLVTSPPPTDSSDRTSPPPPPVQLRRGRRHPSKLKSSSTPRLDRTRETANPVENLRTQLKKLEDLEDLFPASTHTDTYLRYPFTDSGQVGSCELEFFRHRIHLERDSVQRAKEFLKQQRQTFASRQRELRQRQVTLNTGQLPPGSGRLHSELLKDSILQEERELSDMEVSLHRTRSLLGEKIIRLRQLEHSLHQASTTAAASASRNAPTDATLSDLSSHSGSSGFSSNENPSEAPTRRRRPVSGGYNQESSEIVRSLETLNAEIRSLWDLLQRQNGDQLPAGPPPLLVPGSECPWPALTTLAEQLQQIRLQQQVAANSSLVTSSASAASLAERAQGLRDWLRRARLDSAQLAPTS